MFVRWSAAACVLHGPRVTCVRALPYSYSADANPAVAREVQLMFYLALLPPPRPSPAPEEEP